MVLFLPQHNQRAGMTMAPLLPQRIPQQNFCFHAEKSGLCCWRCLLYQEKQVSARAHNNGLIKLEIEAASWKWIPANQ